MSTLKYEFVPGDEKVIALGRTVKRIRALVAIGLLVSPGDVGGYIEKVSNLEQVSGDAWVSGDAKVYGNARVYDNARVSGDARVSDKGSIVWFTGVGSEYGTLTVYATSAGGIELTRGCFRGTIDQFLEASERKHDDATHLEYRMLVEVAHSRITRSLCATES